MAGPELSALVIQTLLPPAFKDAETEVPRSYLLEDIYLVGRTRRAGRQASIQQLVPYLKKYFTLSAFK